MLDNDSVLTYHLKCIKTDAQGGDYVSLARMRASRGLTQEELAVCSGVSRATIARNETARCGLSQKSLMALSRALGCTVDELLCEEDGDEKQGG